MGRSAQPAAAKLRVHSFTAMERRLLISHYKLEAPAPRQPFPSSPAVVAASRTQSGWEWGLIYDVTPATPRLPLSSQVWT